jgi:TRAP-type C4-dicarboxylate transport system permease large subunit
LALHALAASGSMTGATMTSTNCRSMIAAAVFASSGRLNAMMPPKADVGSVLNALS